MKYGLSRVILVDSYMESVVCAARVDGHLNVQGANGAGKTSLLRVLPVFYGERVTNMLRADSGSDTMSFAEYYLPREGSFLIFEYLGDGQPKMVVMYRVSQGGADIAVSLFVDSAYRSDLFFDRESALGKPSSELKMRLSAAGINYYQPVNRTEYRRILLDGQPRKHMRYAMVPHDCQMSKLTPLFSGMFWRKAGFDDLKQIIGEWAMPRQNNDHALALEINRGGAEKWIRDYRAFQALEEIVGSVDDLQQSVQSVHDLSRTISTVKAAIDVRTKSLQVQSTTLEDEKSKANTVHLSWATNRRLELEDLKQDIERHQETYNRQALAIKSIKDQHRIYLDEDLATWQTRLTKLPGLQSQIRQASNFLETAESQSEKLTGTINRAMSSLEETARAERELLNARKEVIGDEFERAAEDARSRVDASIKMLRQQLTALQSQHNEELNKAKLAVALAQNRAENPQPGKEESEALQQALGRQTELESRYGEVLEQISSLNADLSIRKAEREQAIARLNDSKNTRLDMVKERSKLFALRDGGTGTLIHFLREQVPDWEQSIGKVVHTDVLLNGDLSPAAGDGNSLYGVVLDLEVLPDVDYSTDKLTGQIHDLDGEITQLEASIDSIETELKSLAGAIRELEGKGLQLGTDRSRLAKEREEQSNEVRRRQMEVDASIESERSNAAAEAIRLDENVKSLEHDLIAESDKYSSQIANAEGELKHNLSQLKANRDNDRNVVNAAITKLDAETKQKRHDLEKDKTYILAEKGLSPERIQQVQNEYDQLTEELNTLETMRIRIKQFEEFKENELQRLHQLEAEHARHTLTIEGAKQTRAQLSNELVTKNKTHEEQTEVLSRRLTDIDQEIRVLEEVSTISDIETDRQPREEDIQHLSEQPADSLRHNLLDLRGRRRKAYTDLGTTVQPFSRAFQHTAGSICHQYWLSKSESWEGVEQSAALEKAKAAIEYFKGDDGHRTAGSNLALKLRSMAEQVTIYHGQMVTFQSNVRRYATELRSRVAESLRYRALSSITPNIHLDLEELDHWSDIKAFQTLYDRYFAGAQHSDTLPDGDLVDAFQDIVSHLSDGRGSEPAALWKHIRFSFDLVENGQHRHVAKEQSLGSCSSNGLAYLVLITLFLGFLETIRKDAPVHLSWSIDELGNFDSVNIAALLETLSSKNVSLVSACPELGYGQHTLFRYRWRVQRRNRQVWLEQLTPDEGEPAYAAPAQTPEEFA